MIKIYVKFIVSSGGESPKQLVERLRRIGGVPLIGEYDVEIMLGERERLFHKLDAVHRALKGSGALYSVSTGLEGIESTEADMSPAELKSLEVKRKFYREKLAHWKEMGVDTSVLEELLEKDLEKFKEISRTYIREHIERGKGAEETLLESKELDKMIMASLDTSGVSLQSISKFSGLDKSDVAASLERLISAGKVKKLTRARKEIYIRVTKRKAPPPKVVVTPAKSEPEAIQRALSAIRTKGSTVKQICRDSRLPEGQVMNALAELLKSKRLRSVKRGRGMVYLRVPGK